MNSATQTDDVMHEFMFQKFLRDEPEKVLHWLARIPANTRRLLPDVLVELRSKTMSVRKNNIPEWINETFPPPVSWRSQNHRYSVGDISENAIKSRSQIISLPSTRSLKFHPFV